MRKRNLRAKKKISWVRKFHFRMFKETRECLLFRSNGRQALSLFSRFSTQKYFVYNGSYFEYRISAPPGQFETLPSPRPNFLS